MEPITWRLAQSRQVMKMDKVLRNDKLFSGNRPAFRKADARVLKLRFFVSASLRVSPYPPEKQCFLPRMGLNLKAQGRVLAHPGLAN